MFMCSIYNTHRNGIKIYKNVQYNDIRRQYQLIVSQPSLALFLFIKTFSLSFECYVFRNLKSQNESLFYIKHKIL